MYVCMYVRTYVCMYVCTDNGLFPDKLAFAWPLHTFCSIPSGTKVLIHPYERQHVAVCEVQNEEK